jgi:hypothetical protein
VVSATKDFSRLRRHPIRTGAPGARQAMATAVFRSSTRAALRKIQRCAKLKA